MVWQPTSKSRHPDRLRPQDNLLPFQYVTEEALAVCIPKANFERQPWTREGSVSRFEFTKLERWRKEIPRHQFPKGVLAQRCWLRNAPVPGAKSWLRHQNSSESTICPPTRVPMKSSSLKAMRSPRVKKYVSKQLWNHKNNWL